VTVGSILKALRPTVFDWTVHVDEIWSDPVADIGDLHASARTELDEQLEELIHARRPASPLGVVLRGDAGSGKTHLLSYLRRTSHRADTFFVLADMTDVRDFWETVLLGYLRSLQQPMGGERQLDVWLHGIVDRYGAGIDKIADIPEQRPPGLILRCNELVAKMTKREGADARDHADVLRALLLFACTHDDVNDMGYKWLQGIGIDAEEQQHYGFREARRAPSRIVQGLSWLLSLHAPTVLAMDQLDAIVSEHNAVRLAELGDDLTPEQAASLGIVRGIAGGLMALRDLTRRTLSVVSTLEATWRTLVDVDVGSMPDRFEAPITLTAADQAQALRRLIEGRLAPSYAAERVSPPYASYPFTEDFFTYRRGSTPREVLKACKAHARACRKAGEVRELGEETEGEENVGGTTQPPSPAIDAQFDALRRNAPLEAIFADKTERRLDELIEAACRALVYENPTPPGVDAIVDTDFTSTASYDPLHARLRLLLSNDGERERHLSMRFLEKTHATAFQARLKAAVTASGVDKELPFRRLTVLRNAALPTGKASKALLKELADRGGQIRVPQEDELRSLHALHQLLEMNLDGFEEWLMGRRPVSTMPLFRDDAAWLFEGHTSWVSGPPLEGQPPVERAPAPPTKSGPRPPTPVPRPPKAGPPPTPSAGLMLGHAVTASGPGAPISVAPAMLRNHVCVLAGSGSGKTVFLRRVIENAVLLGVPAIVLDGANDLVRLGTPWPTTPDAWGPADPGLAEAYFRRAEVVVWTPGRMSGNPLFLDPLPNFAAIREGGDAGAVSEELEAAREMAAASLQPLVAPGKSAKAKKARAILRVALREISQLPKASLSTLVRHLIEPSDDVIGLYKSGESIAREAGELLQASIQSDPLLGDAGPKLDPGMLLHASSPDRVRVSVVNLSGLADGSQRQSFVNQLAMALFTWIKRNPAQGDLAGLFVVDEAKDFVPSGANVPSKQSLVRLAAQARKYGLGLLFASQAPKSIDHNVVANAATLLIGKQSSPAAINAAEELLASKGGRVSDVGRLTTGRFYAALKDERRPTKIGTALCLSHHPHSPPSEEEVLELARQTRGT
jgi:hypothetical protein